MTTTSPIGAASEYSETTFERLCLPNADLSRSEFNDCVFRGCRFPDVDLSKARFEHCVFETTDLSNAKVTETRFVDCTFRGTKLLGINWTLAQQPIFMKAVECNFEESNFQGVNLCKLILTGCNFRNADFEQAKLKQAQFTGSSFQGARFNKTDLSQADLRDATDYAIDPRNNLLKRARFSTPEALSLLSALGIILD